MELDSLRKKNVPRDKLGSIINLLKEQGKRIVFTNGCFDIIHRGHVEYLAQASDLGDIFVLGLNTDSSVKRLKGNDRPVNNEDSRAMVLSAFQFVDYIVSFEEDTPLELITYLLPDILVKGGDYEINNIVGYDVVTKNNGVVITIPFVQGYSTSSVIEKISKSS